MVVALIDLIYTFIAIPASRVVTHVLALFDRKWARLVRERRQWRAALAALPGGTRIWFHAASMGEFEQLVPIIDRLRMQVADPVVVVTVSSVSAIDHARSINGVDAACVLPADGRSMMRHLVLAVAPALCVIGRYDLWRNMVRALEQAGTPVVVVNATAPRRWRTPLVSTWLGSMYRCASYIYATTTHDAAALQRLAPNTPVVVESDTRLDRVQDRIHSSTGGFDYVRSKLLTVVIGSSWPADERLWRQALTSAMRERIRLIIVPHEPTPDRVAGIAAAFNATRLSTITAAEDGTIVVDTMGALVELYGIADAAFVGGGFGAGVHSTTEPAIYGIPIAAGPRIERSADALSLRDAGLLTCVDTVDAVQEWITTTVLSVQARELASVTAEAWTRERTGSADRIARELVPRLIAQQ